MSLLLAPLLACLLGAAPSAPTAAAPHAAASAPLLILALDLESVNSDPETTKAVGRLVVAALGELPEVQVTSQDDMRTLANLDAARQAMDCAATSCLADLAGALGARAVLFGSVTGLGGTTSIALSLYDSKTARISRRNVDAHELGAVPEALRPAVRALLTDAGLIREVEAPPGPSALFLGGVGAAAVGGTLLVGGAITTGVCELQLQQATMPGAEKEPLQQAGQLGLVTAAVGAVVGGVGAVLLFLPEGP